MNWTVNVALKFSFLSWQTATIASIDSDDDDTQDMGSIRDAVPPEVLAQNAKSDSPLLSHRQTTSTLSTAEKVAESPQVNHTPVQLVSPPEQTSSSVEVQQLCSKSAGAALNDGLETMSDSAWECFHRTFHGLISNEDGNLATRLGRTEELHQLVADLRQRWTAQLELEDKERTEQLTSTVEQLKRQCVNLQQQLDLRQEENQQLTAEMSAVRGVDKAKVAEQTAAVLKLSNNLASLRNELAEEQARRDGAERDRKQLENHLATVRTLVISSFHVHAHQ